MHELTLIVTGKHSRTYQRANDPANPIVYGLASAAVRRVQMWDYPSEVAAAMDTETSALVR